jgi:hypothetical protein
MRDTFDIHKWKTYQMFLNESDDDFEFTDTDKELAAGLNTIELKVGDYITPDMWKDSITSNLSTREYFKHLTSVPRKIKRTQYFENDGFYWWLEDFNAEFKNNNLKPEFKVISDLDEQDDDFEFTDIDKELAMSFGTWPIVIEMTNEYLFWDGTGERYYFDEVKVIKTNNDELEELLGQNIPHNAQFIKDLIGENYIQNDDLLDWLHKGQTTQEIPGYLFKHGWENQWEEVFFKVYLPSTMSESDDFEFTDTDKELASYLGVDDELKVGSIVIPQMWDKEALERSIDYLKVGEDSKDTLKQYKKFLKEPHTISGLFKSELVPDSKDYYKIVFTNGSVIHSSYLKPEFNTFKPLSESDDDFEFTDTDKDLAANLNVKELTVGDTIMPNMWIDVFEKGETLKKYQIKSLKSSPHKITNIEVIGDDRVLMFGEIDDYYYTNDFLKPQYRVVLPDDLDELNEAWSEERKKQDPEGYAKYLEKAKQRDKQYREKLKQDPEAWAKYQEKNRQNAKQYQEKNPEKQKHYIKKLKQDPEAYAKHLEKQKRSREKLKQDPEAYAKYLERLKQYREKNPEKIKQYQEKYQEKYREKNREKIKQYIEKNREKIKQDPEAYAKYLEKQKQYREKNPEKIKQSANQYYEKNREKIKQSANQYYEKNPEKVKQRLKQSYEKLKQDPEAYAKHLEKLKQRSKQRYEKLKQDYDNYVKQSSDFFYNTITNNPSPELGNIKDNPKLLTKLYYEFIKKAKQRYKAKNKDFSFMITEFDDFEFTDADKDLASSLANDIILEPGYVFNGDEIKDDKSLRARLIGKTITRYYTRKSPLLNSRDQIMMDIEDVSGKEIQYMISKLKPNYFIPDKVYNLKLGEEYK